MTAERAEAYGRVMTALTACVGLDNRDDVARIRLACDGLVLAGTASPEDRHAMTDAVLVLADLVERGDISRPVASAIVDNIGRCGPATHADSKATT